MIRMKTCVRRKQVNRSHSSIVEKELIWKCIALAKMVAVIYDYKLIVTLINMDLAT